MHIRLSFSLALLWLIAPTALAAPITYLVEVDTTAVQGVDGYLDFQFNAQGATFQDAIVSVTTVGTDALLDGTSQVDGGGSGVLPGPLTISNSDIFNAVFQGLTFGSFFDFVLTFSGDAIDTPITGSDINAFALTLLDDSFIPLLTTNPLGDALTAEILDTGSIDIITYDADSGGTPSVVTVTAQQSAVPIPFVPALLIPSLILITVTRAARQRSQR